MRKLMIMASMLAMVLLAASPVMAQDAGSGGDAADDSIGGAGGDATSAQYNTQLCQNIIGDINVTNENTAANYGGDDTAIQGVEGDGNAVSLSQDEAQAIAQENDTTINIVQQCFNQSQQAQGEDIAQGQAGQNVVGGGEVADDGETVIGPAAEDHNGDGVVDVEDDVNGDGVVGAEDAEVVADADTNGDGVVDAAEAEAFATATAGGATATAETGDAAASAETGDAAASAETGDAAASAETGAAEAGSVAVLPDTGGASLFTLGAGALLVAGGLLARRIVR